MRTGNPTPNFGWKTYNTGDPTTWVDVSQILTEIDADMSDALSAIPDMQTDLANTSTIANSAQATANSADAKADTALGALANVGTWQNYTPNNPNATVFSAYSGTLFYNTSLNILYLQLFAGTTSPTNLNNTVIIDTTNWPVKPLPELNLIRGAGFIVDNTNNKFPPYHITRDTVNRNLWKIDDFAGVASANGASVLLTMPCVLP